jgi:type IX secretion system PorP/SprF family membrane protein
LGGFGLAVEEVYSQDPQFSQFYANQLYLNPAFAGSARCARFSANYRNQWPAISGNYVTYSASYDQHIDAINGGIGFLAYNDYAGDGTLNSLYLSGIYSYKLDVSRKFTIRAGFQAAYGQRRVDWDRLTFGDQIDQRYGFIYNTQETRPDETTGYFDVSAGLIGYTEMFYFGFAANHLTRPNEGFLGQARLPIKWTGHFGAVIPLNQRSKYQSEATISPNILFKMQQQFRQLNIGFYASKGPYVGGLWYRNMDSFIALVGIHKDRLRIGYSYDITISRLTTMPGGAHEVSLGYTVDCRPPGRRFRTVRCPSF